MKSLRLLWFTFAAFAAFGFVWQAWDMFGPAHRPMLQGWDDSYYYYWLPSAVIDHDLDFSNQLAHSGTIDTGVRDEALAQPRTRTGLLPNKYPPGWALGSLPFFAAARLFAPSGSTGFEPIYLILVWLGQLGYAALGLWCAVKIVERFCGRNVAPLAVWLTWAASPLLYYQTAKLWMSHSQVFALAMIVFHLALCIRDGKTQLWRWFVLGFASALLVVTRNLAIVYLLMPAWAVRSRLGNLRHIAALVAGAAVPVAVQLVAWRLLYGSWVVYSYGGERFDFSQLHLGDILFSARHGWFYWNPLLLVGIVAFLSRAWRTGEGCAWVVSLVLITLLNAAWPMWWLGSSFGHRGFEVATLFAMCGLGWLLAAVEARPRLRAVLLTVCGLAVVWNILLFTLFLTGRISRDEPVTYSQAIRALHAPAAPNH